MHVIIQVELVTYDFPLLLNELSCMLGGVLIYVTQ
jgi:hypothetical protein